MKLKQGVFGLIILASAFLAGGCKKSIIMYAGRFTKGDEKGLYVFEFNKRNGSLMLKSMEDVGPGPSFFCFSRDRNLLYVINEVMEFRDNSGGGLTTLRLNNSDDMQFEKLNEMVLPYGGPCHISISAGGGHLLVANYPKGSVVVVKLNKDGVPEKITDTILYVKEEPGRSHAHMIKHDPAGKFVYVADLGLDRVLSYNLDTLQGKLIEDENGAAFLPEGSGPRHFVFNSNGSVMYLINELGSTITVFNADKNCGTLNEAQTVKTISEDYIEKITVPKLLWGKMAGSFMVRTGVKIQLWSSEYFLTVSLNRKEGFPAGETGREIL